ncbi:hypothetical protein [Sodalinema gerasimenkoae]|uniref:hypothetical protein n=1 Tax=Sodalinema gerasimenkoae TaxID=2862348 RepID=UPI00135B0381|nr:hypothetical protein [Sodalinema gerasimenkoae]
MLEPILAYFGGLLELVAALIGFVLGWWLFSYLFWGLPWSRIVTKAGYRGSKKKLLIRAIYWPTLFAPVPILLFGFGEFIELLGAASILLTACQWIAIYYVCFSKWPVQQRETPKEETPSTTK